MINLISFLSASFISITTISRLTATETQDILSTTGNFYSHANANTKIISKEQYLNSEIEDLKSSLQSLKNSYKGNTIPANNIYIRDYESMIKELSEFNEQISSKSLKEVKNKVGKAYNKYFPQDDD